VFPQAQQSLESVW